MRGFLLFACLVIVGCDKKSQGPLPANPKQPDQPQAICTQAEYKNCPPR